MAKKTATKKYAWKCSETNEINYIVEYKEQTTGPKEQLKRKKYSPKLRKHTSHVLVKLK